MTFKKKEIERLEKAVLKLNYEKAESITVQTDLNDDYSYIDTTICVSIRGVQLTFVRSTGDGRLLYINGRQIFCDEGNRSHSTPYISVTSEFFDNLLRIAKERQKESSEIVDILERKGRAK